MREEDTHEILNTNKVLFIFAWAFGGLGFITGLFAMIVDLGWHSIALALGFVCWLLLVALIHSIKVEDEENDSRFSDETLELRDRHL